jgi:hypothetical protein
VLEIQRGIEWEAKWGKRPEEGRGTGKERTKQERYVDYLV